MKTKLIIKLEMSKSDETLEVWACAKETLNGWQGGVGIEPTVTWYPVYAPTANKAIEAMTKRVAVNVKDGQLVIEVKTDD
jgi:hypothetical protein